MQTSCKRILLVALYSERYPAIGESHGISTLAGYLTGKYSANPPDIQLLDMVRLGRQATNELIDIINSFDPEIVGLSLTYGTYDYCKEIICNLLFHTLANRMIIFGGPLATYLPTLLLEEIYNNAIVVVGEGEEAFTHIVQIGNNKEKLKAIPNIVFMSNGEFFYTKRQLSDLNNFSLPYRKYLTKDQGLVPQIYTESSRGCSWARCTFCLRGLLDLKGLRSEYRLFPLPYIVGDLIQIYQLGYKSITFADEDLLGSTSYTAQHIVKALEDFTYQTGAILSIDASLTVHSIYNSDRKIKDQNDRNKTLTKLHTLGLRKIFLGIESGSPSQLKRYAKGHTREECIEAINILRSIGFEIELGWIPFDPLCTLIEVKENADFLLKNNAADHVSFMFNEIRIQINSRYLNILKRHQILTGRKLWSDIVDPNTLSMAHSYENPDISDLVSTTRTWGKKLHPVQYPLKNVTRFGTSGAIKEISEESRIILQNLRFNLCQLLSIASTEIEESKSTTKTDSIFELIRTQFANQVVEMLNNKRQLITNQPLIQSIYENAIQMQSGSNK